MAGHRGVLAGPLGAPRLDPEPLELRDRRRQQRSGRGAVDEKQVEPVADAEPIETGLDHRLRHRRVGRCRQVEDAAALSVRERADAVLGGMAGERGGGLAAAAQDHERQHGRQRDERTCAFPVRRADEPDRVRRQPGLGQRRSKDLVDERGDGAERRAAGPEHGAVQALQQLSCDVDGDVRPRLEVGADDADRDAPLRDLEAVRQCPGRDLAVERRQRRQLAQLLLDRRQALRVEAEPIERTLVELALGGIEIGRVRLEHGSVLCRQALRCQRERRGDPVVGEQRHRCSRGGRLALDRLEDRHGGQSETARARASSITCSASTRLP